MQLVKVLCVALVGLSLAAAVAANVADGANEKAAVQDKCGARGGHCEAAASCGGRKLKGLCEDNGSGTAVACCLPGKKAKKGKGLSPKQLAAKRKARAAAAKKQAKAAKAAAASMAAQTAMAKALAKDVPAPSGKKAPAQPTTAEAEKAAKEGAAVAKAAAPQPPAAAKKAKKLKAKKLKLKVKKSKKQGKKHGKKKAKALKKKSNTKKLGMRVKKGSRGVDVAQKTSKKHWQCLKKAGWDWAVVRGFRSSNRPDPHAARSLKHAAKAGFGRRKLGVYLYPCAKCGDAKGQVDRMIKHLKNHGAHRLFSTIWLDVEGRFWPAPKRTRKQKAAALAALAAKRAAAVAAAKVSGNTGVVAPAPLKKQQKKQKKSSRHGEARAFFRSLVRACRAHKRYRCGVYTSAQQWQSIMGKRPIRMAKKMPLWYPQFDVTPSAATTDFEGFSGWDNAWAKQYSENQNVCGLSADVNVRA